MTFFSTRILWNYDYGKESSNQLSPCGVAARKIKYSQLISPVAGYKPTPTEMLKNINIKSIFL